MLRNKKTSNDHRGLALAALVGSLLAGACATFAPPAAAHSFYSKRCCDGKDCAPVERIEFLGNGAVKATTKHGTVVFPPGFKMLPSQDGRFHACMRHYAEWGDSRLRGICLYAPAGM